MSSNHREIFILKDGCTIYGTYSTKEKAEEALEMLSDVDNYGEDLNSNNTACIKIMWLDGYLRR